MLAIWKLIALGKGQHAYKVTCSGNLADNPYEITCDVLLGPQDRGLLTITHTSFNHLSSPVPAACYSIDLHAEPGQLGGQRWFMICPQSGRQVFKLYLPNGGRRFASREYFGLAYRVQRLDLIGKGHARLARAYSKLGTHYQGLHQPIPGRPKWMRHKTYARLVDDIQAATCRHREAYRNKLRVLIAAEDEVAVGRVKSASDS